MNLTDFKKRLLWGLGILFILILWITFPLIFKEWIFTLLVKPPFTPEVFATLGPIGDIFGGLTALFTSATLIIVMYSAYLQRQANKDAREAIAEQLKQAREATEEQLKQAKEATEDQINQASESTIKQLNLAQSTHNAQLKETMYSNFLSTYNSLINYKLAKYNTIQVFIDGRTWHAEEIFKDIAIRFYKKKEIFDLQLTRNQIGDLYNKTLEEIAGTDKGLLEINSYFRLYKSIFDLISTAEISEEEKLFFRKLTSNTMSLHEQLTLLWASTYLQSCSELIKNTGIFNQFYSEYMMPFIVGFFEKSSFNHEDILSNWDRFSK